MESFPWRVSDVPYQKEKEKNIFPNLHQVFVGAISCFFLGGVDTEMLLFIGYARREF